MQTTTDQLSTQPIASQATPSAFKRGPKPLAPDQRQQQMLFKLSSKNRDTFNKLAELIQQNPKATKGQVLEMLLGLYSAVSYFDISRAACWYDGESYVIQSNKGERYKGTPGQNLPDLLVEWHAAQGQG